MPLIELADVEKTYHLGKTTVRALCGSFMQAAGEEYYTRVYRVIRYLKIRGSRNSCTTRRSEEYW